MHLSFESTTYRLVDGGLSANDPTQSVTIEAEKLFGRNQPHKILSLGAGDIVMSYPEKKYKGAGLITWGLALKDLFLSGQRTLTRYSMQHQYGDHYSYWSPKITISDTAIDNYRPEALQHYKTQTLRMIASREGEFKKLVTQLLVNRRLLRKVITR